MIMSIDFQTQTSNQLPARGLGNGIPKLNPISPADGRQSPFKFPSQSTTSSHATPNSSISQDSAFPPFPTSRSRSTTPTTPSDIKQSFAFYSLDQQPQRDSYSSFAPLSPRDNGGGSVLQRMDAIAPGPFNLSNKGNAQPSGHKKTATMGSSKDFTYQSAGTGKGHSSRPSTAGSNNSRKPSLSSISGGPRSTVNRGKPNTPNIPNETLPFRRSQTAEMIDGESTTTTAHEESLIEALHQENRSRTYPLDDPIQKRGEELRRDVTRRPSAPSLHVTRPSVAAAIRPLHEIGSVSSFKPSRSIRIQAKSPVTALTREPSAKPKDENDIPDEKILEQGPNLNASNHAKSYVVGNPQHTPNQSVSSNDSSGSDGKSGSSMSTPPLSSSPQRQKRRPSNTSRGGSLIREFQFGLGDKPETPHHDAPTLSLNSSMDVPLKNPPVSTEAGTLAPRSMHDPAIHSGRASPVTTPEDSFNRFPLESGNLLLSPAPPPPSVIPISSPRKPVKANKGRCRGCGELIIGKSVSSADGRLTGRYHKRCFVCLTCKEPFQTADFYVLENHPYCEQHYHRLNNSICGTCDRGIEGQYLETELKQKFHPECFKCQVGVIRKERERSSLTLNRTVKPFSEMITSK